MTQQNKLQENEPMLNRFMNVDLIDFLGEISKKVIVHYPNDWNIDKDTLFKTADTISQNPEPQSIEIAWHVSSMGTHIVDARDVFIKDSGAHAYWTDYHQNDPDMFGFFVEVTGGKNGSVMGNVFEVGNYSEHAKYVQDIALPLHSITLKYSDDWGINAGKIITVNRHEYDDDRNRLMSQSGNVRRVTFNPADENELTAILNNEHTKQLRYQHGDIEAYLQRLTDRLAKIRSVPKDSVKDSTSKESISKKPSFKDQLDSAIKKANEINKQNIPKKQETKNKDTKEID